MSMTRLLEAKCAKLILNSALMDVASDVEANRIFGVNEHSVCQALMVKIQLSMSGAGIRISEQTYRMVTLYVSGSPQAFIAAELNMGTQTQVSEMLTLFRMLIRLQTARIRAKYPHLAILASASTSTSMMKYAVVNINDFMLMMHDLKEGKL